MKSFWGSSGTLAKEQSGLGLISDYATHGARFKA